MDCNEQKVYELMIGELSQEESQKALEHIKGCGECAERAHIIGILENSPPFSKATGWPLKNWMLAAAAVLTFLLMPKAFDRGEEIIKDPSALATKEIPGSFPLDVRANDENLKKEAFREYNERNFQEAERLFGDIENPDAETTFFRGVTRYVLHLDDSAMADLEKSRSYPQWTRVSSWYLANLHLRAGRISEALQELDKIAGNPGSYSREAQLLRSRIRNRTGLK